MNVLQNFSDTDTVANEHPIVLPVNQISPPLFSNTSGATHRSNFPSGNGAQTIPKNPFSLQTVTTFCLPVPCMTRLEKSFVLGIFIFHNVVER